MTAPRLTTCLVLLSLFFTSTTCHAQDQGVSSKDLTWQQLTDQYEVPQWFTDARFGVWVHWGPQSVPELGGGWYARHMYMQRRRQRDRLEKMPIRII